MKPVLCVISTVFYFVTVLHGESAKPRFVTFSAKEKSGIYLRNLKISEVRLFVDDQPVKVSYLGYKNVETAIAFVLENSPRTAPHTVSMPQWGKINPLDQIRYQLVGSYFDQLVKNGVVLIAEFSKDIRLLQDFTNDEFELENAVSRMQPNSMELMPENIEIGRAIAFGLEQLKHRPEKRKILVLVTRTVDRESYKNMKEYQETLRRSDIDLYVISFASRFPPSHGTTFEEKQNRYFFLQLVNETSGKLYLSGEYAFISEFTDDLRTRLEHTYTLGFYPPETGGEPTDHKIKIVVRNEDVEVTHRGKMIW
ncbi:MAG TPA: VWA domain-containing protein [Acidobacteriota bacterium]|nr:VWA domain-containing protein [Acidobacteriota bacterium]